MRVSAFFFLYLLSRTCSALYAWLRLQTDSLLLLCHSSTLLCFPLSSFFFTTVQCAAFLRGVLTSGWRFLPIAFARCDGTVCSPVGASRLHRNRLHRNRLQCVCRGETGVRVEVCVCSQRVLVWPSGHWEVGTLEGHHLFFLFAWSLFFGSEESAGLQLLTEQCERAFFSSCAHFLDDAGHLNVVLRSSTPVPGGKPRTSLLRFRAM